MEINPENEPRESLMLVAKLLSPMIVLLLVSMIMMGCISQAQGVDKNNQSTNSTMTNNKTGYQQTQETISSVVPDGTYSNNVTYAYHAGVNTVDITISVKGDLITDASVVGLNPDPISAHHISAFNAALPDLVVGKRIDQLNIPKQVAGSSLTTAAFVKYVDSIGGNVITQ